MRWWPLATLLLTQAAVSPPSAPSTALQSSEPPSHGYVIGLTEGSSACSSGECGEELGTKNVAGYSYQPIDLKTTAGVSAAGHFTTRACYDVRQVLLIAAQIPNADGSWRTCEELATLGATHPAARPERSGSDGDKAMLRQRRWFEKNMAAQIRELLRTKRASIYIAAAAPNRENRENGPAKAVLLSEVVQDFGSDALTEHALMWMPGMHDWRQILTYYPALTHVLMNWRVSGGWNGSVAHGEVTKIFQLLQLAKLPLDSCSWLVQCQARSDSDATLEVSRHPPGLAKARIAAVAAAQGRQLGKDGSLPRPLADEPASATPEQLADLASASEGQLPLGASPPPPTWLPPPPMPPLVKAHVSKPSFFRPSPGGVPSSRPVKLPPPPPPPPGRRPGEVRSSGAASGAPEAILFFVGRQSDAAWDPHSQRGFLDGATVSAQTATAIANLGYRVVVAGHIVAGTRGMVHFVHEDRLRLVSPPVNKRELLAGLPEWLGDVPPGEPLFDHIVIVRFVAQFTLRFQMTARVGVHVWLHDTAPSGLIWVQPNASAHSLTPSEHASRSTHGAMPDLRTASNLALLANVGGQVDRLIVHSSWHQQSLVSHLGSLSPMLPPGARGTVRPRVAVVPSGVDVAEWRRARDNFTASGARKKRHAFFYCCLVNHQGLLDLVELFPTLRSSLHGATLTAASLLPDAPMNAETLAVFESLPWARYAGVLDRAAFEHELLSAETLIYLSPDSRHLPLLEAMMADIAILMPRLEPWHPFAPILGDGRALILERDSIGRNMMDVALVREVCEDGDRLAAVAAAARAYAEERSLDAAARAWEGVFEEVRQARFDDAPFFKLAAQHRAAQAAASAAAEGAEGGNARPAGQPTAESLQAGLLVLGGWLAGSVWLLVVHLRHRVWSPPLPIRPPPHGRAKQA